MPSALDAADRRERAAPLDVPPAAGGRVCIITPGYLSSSPRAVREADALTSSGFDVRVVCSEGPLEYLRASDEELRTSARWQVSTCRWSDGRPGERWAYHRSRARHRLFRAMPAASWRIAGVAERAEGRLFPELAALAAAHAADLYVGHYPAGLAAAYQAARRHGAALSYDVEDLYADTLSAGDSSSAGRERILHLERRYAHRCRYISAVSQPVAHAFAERHDVETPIVVHNCHPWADRGAADGRVRDRAGDGLSLYWFSQTVGLDRGLQDVIRAAGTVPAAVRIHVRGAMDEGVRRALAGEASAAGLESRVHFHEPASPREMLSRAMEHDVGLALEPGGSLNNRLTVSNKILLYLTAGLAVVATATEGQRSVLDTCPGAGFLYESGDIGALSRQLARWASNSEALAVARQASAEAAHARWNWEHESRQLVAAVGRAVASSRLRAGS